MLEGPRAAKLDELPKIIHLVNSIFMPGLGLPPIIRKLFPHLFSESNLKNLRVIVHDGNPISHVGIWEGTILIYGCLFKIGMIGSVCTHPDYRGRGYASALVKDAFSKMKRDHVDFVLVSGFRSLYKRAGYVEAGRVYVYRIKRGDLHLNMNRNHISIAPYKMGHAKDLVEVYQREPVRYRRSLEEFRLLADRGFKCNNVKLKSYIAKIGGRPIAYIATEFLRNENEPSIIEYAGPRDIVLCLIENLFKDLNAETIKLTVPHHDLSMLYLLEEEKLEKSPSKALASMAIINPYSFLEKIQPYLEERIGKKEAHKFIFDLKHDKIKLYLNEEEVDFQDSRALTLLFFEAPEKLIVPPQPKVKIEPYPESLLNVLPLPTPIYGLNYI